MEPQNVITQLKTLTSHPHVTLTHRGDGAILLALHIVKCISKLQTLNSELQTILIPHEAGWLSYKTLPSLLGFDIIEVKTDNGLIDLDDLKEKIQSANPAALLIQSLAGYFVEQPMEEIIKICKEPIKNSKLQTANSKLLIIEDISGSIGFLPSYASDIKVCSFGKDKLVNLGAGGFLSCKEDFITQFAEQLTPTLRLVQPLFDSSLLNQKLASLKSRAAFLSAKAQKIKSDLVHHPIIHQKSSAINVVIGFSDDAEKALLIDYCKKNSLPFKPCPRYNRVLAPAVSIEVKKLEQLEQ